jgi:hypothetical protein
MPAKTEEYDYTRGDDIATDDDSGVPFGTDDYEIKGSAIADQSADEIERQNSFREIPPGDHLLVVVGFRGSPEEKSSEVIVDGSRVTFRAAMVRVKLALVGDLNATIEDSFLLLPDDRAYNNAYFKGVPVGKKEPGWQAKKFAHFINRIGFTWLPGQPLPTEAKRLGNWKGRKVGATIIDGGTYQTNTGETKKSWNKIKPFSYTAASAFKPSAPVQSSSARQAQTRLAPQQPARQPVGIDDL